MTIFKYQNKVAIIDRTDGEYQIFFSCPQCSCMLIEAWQAGEKIFICTNHNPFLEFELDTHSALILRHEV